MKSKSPSSSSIRGSSRKQSSGRVSKSSAEKGSGSPTMAQRRRDQRSAQFRQLALASVLLSSAGFVISFFGCIPGIVCGHIVRAACRRDPELPGRGYALAALVIGYGALFANLVAIGLLLVNLANREPVVDPFEQLDL